MHRQLTPYRYQIYFHKGSDGQRELSILYCPTHIMVEDYSIKQLQGTLFNKSQDILMGGFSPYTLLEDIFILRLQLKHHEDGDKWNKLLHRQLTPYRYQIYFHKGSDGQRELSILYCPTHIMVEDYSIKQLQGTLFNKSQDILMGGFSPYTLLEDIFILRLLNEVKGN